VHSLLKNLDWRRFLARPQLPSPPAEVLDALRREPILVTGAGGSIGSALALRLGALGTRKLVLLDASESNLYALERDWAAAPLAAPATVSRMTAVLGSAADEALLNEIFATHAPQVVFHAAAFKHVPLMEQQPLAAIQNNIFATEALARAAEAHDARVVLLSTDKAVEPASVMGATKRVAEQIVLAHGGTVLRLANVLASRDSVAEIFARQIVQGGPVTVTDPAARRYFLALDEAVDLLLASAGDTEAGALLAPILPAAHSIAELARFMIDELAPNSNIAFQLIGNRPGDKQTEKLWSKVELIHPVNSGALVSIESRLLTTGQLAAGLASLHGAVDARDLGDALKYLRALVPDYTPSRAVLALAQQCGPRVCL
jgi:FlaA1/EpsC-like NDP-sugar epimerase